MAGKHRDYVYKRIAKGPDKMAARVGCHGSRRSPNVAHRGGGEAGSTRKALETPNTAKNREYLNRCMDLMRLQRSSHRTIESRELDLRQFIRFVEDRGIEDLREVTRKDVDDYQSYLYCYRKPDGNPYAIQTQTIKLSAITCFYRLLVRAGLLLFNPAADIELPRRGQRLPSDILSKKDMRKILAAPDTSTVYGYRDRTLLEVLYSTGVRTAELCALTVDDIDFDDGFLQVLEGKGLKDRTVPLGEIACKYLAEYIKNVRPHLVRHKSGSILFLTRSGRSFDGSSIHKKLKSYSEKCAIEKNVTARSFRTTAATDMLRGKANIRQIQEMLGHRSLSTTQIYARVIRDDLKKEHQKTHPRETIRTDEDIRYKGGNIIE